MPKVKIGDKLVAGENPNNEMRRFNNGHKTFTAMETKTMHETHSREIRAVKIFNTNRTALIKPRNPVLGEETPRTTFNLKGETRTTGELLFSPDRFRKKDSPITSREDPYKQNPLKRQAKEDVFINSIEGLQDNINGELNYLKIKMEATERELKGCKPIRF